MVNPEPLALTDRRGARLNAARIGPGWLALAVHPAPGSDAPSIDLADPQVRELIRWLAAAPDVSTPAELAARRDLAATAGPLAERHVTDCARCGFAIAPGQHVEAVLPAGFVLAPGQPVTLREAVAWAHVDCRAAGTPGQLTVTHVEGQPQ